MFDIIRAYGILGKIVKAIAVMYDNNRARVASLTVILITSKFDPNFCREAFQQPFYSL